MNNKSNINHGHKVKLYHGIYGLYQPMETSIKKMNVGKLELKGFKFLTSERKLSIEKVTSH